MHRPTVVVDMNPVAYLCTRAVELRRAARQNIGNLPRDEFLYVLVSAIVIGAVRDCCADAEGTHPSTDQVVGTGFGCRIRAGRPVCGGLGELLAGIECEITENLVGRDVVKTLIVLPHRLEQAIRADDVGLHER